MTDLPEDEGAEVELAAELLGVRVRGDFVVGVEAGAGVGVAVEEADDGGDAPGGGGVGELEGNGFAVGAGGVDDGELDGFAAAPLSTPPWWLQAPRPLLAVVPSLQVTVAASAAKVGTAEASHRLAVSRQSEEIGALMSVLLIKRVPIGQLG